jgi:hypothetical protein
METIKLTPKQFEAVEWALDVMPEHWCTEDGCYGRDGELYSEDKVPYIVDKTLVLSSVVEINEDLLYRLDTQLYDMTNDDWDDKQAELAYRPIQKLVDKMKDMGYENPI